MVRSKKFIEDYGRTFKDQRILINGVDIRLDSESILNEFGILHTEYEHLYTQNAKKW